LTFLSISRTVLNKRHLAFLNTHECYKYLPCDVNKVVDFSEVRTADVIYLI